MSDQGSFRMRMGGLLRKEVLQIVRDPSSIALAIVMPVFLLFVFGFGVSLDPKNVPIAVVIGDPGSAARDLAARFELSRYFDAVEVGTMGDAVKLVRSGEVDGIVRVRDDFSPQLALSGRAPVQLILNGVDANRARLVQGYVRGVVGTWMDGRAARGLPAAGQIVRVEPRIWFNETAESANFLVPGLMTLIMTLIGTLLTALVIAREWERGTMEAILVTPLRTGEMLLGKILPYFVLGMAGMALSVVLGLTLFGVPLRGSVWLLTLLGSLFMAASLGLGLAISAATRVQFVAAQMSVVVGFLPAFFLSGLLFDLGSTPRFVQLISHLIPARYFVLISHTLFLAGDIPSVLVPAGAVLALMAAVLLAVARAKLGRRLPT